MARAKCLPLQMMHCFLKYTCTYTLGQSCHWGSDHKLPCTGKSFRARSPKGVVLYTSPVLSFMVKWSERLHTTRKTCFTPQPQSNSNLPLFRKLIWTVGCGLNLKKWWEEKGSVKPSCWSCSVLHGIRNRSLSWRKGIACKEEPLQEGGLSVPHPKNSP